MNSAARYAAHQVEEQLGDGYASLERDEDHGEGDSWFFWEGGLADGTKLFACIHQENNGELAVTVEVRDEDHEPMVERTQLTLNTRHPRVAAMVLSTAIMAELEAPVVVPTTEVNTAAYQAAHGQEPAGLVGRWMFATPDGSIWTAPIVEYAAAVADLPQGEAWVLLP